MIGPMSTVFYPAPPKGRVSEILAHHREEAMRREEQVYFRQAAQSKDHTRPDGPEEDHRLPYKRDVDRIVHSKAYARYIDKTQVVYLVDNDHIAHRLLHVQLVSSFARGVAEILGLNVDLVEAIALGHDVGHPPFGHEGETYLSKLQEEAGGGAFAHPAQSCRLFREIEPLNLGLSVYDGFLCHDGGSKWTRFSPNFDKTWIDHERERVEKLENPDENIWPGTLEGCLVKLCDTVSYLGRDIEDALRLGILALPDVPRTILGTRNREILSVIAADIIEQSYEKDYIAISEEVFEALKVLRRFNFQRIYTHPKLKVESVRVQRGYRILFEILLEEYSQKGDGSHLWRKFLHNKRPQYVESSTPVQLVVDYISGMTDNYFVSTLESLILPQNIELVT